MISPDGSPAASLATSWTATDSGKTYTFELRDDATWHNGKPVTADSINYHIQDVSVTVAGPHTIKMQLKAAYSPFPTLVAKPLFLPGLVGFGPYKVGRIRLKGDAVNYLKLIPMNGRGPNREYRFYRTETLAVTAYKVGDVDRLEDMSSPHDLTSWGNTQIVATPQHGRIISLFFNMNHPLLKEKSFRQALAYGVPPLAGDRALSPIPNTSWAFTDKVKKYAYTPATVAKLLAATKKPTEADPLILTTFLPYLETADTIAASWRELGIATQVRVESTVPSEYQVLLSAQDVPPDPDQYPFWHSTQTNTNITHYVNVKIDKLLEDGRQTTDLEARKKYYADFQRHIVEDIPAFTLVYGTVYAISRK